MEGPNKIWSDLVSGFVLSGSFGAIPKSSNEFKLKNDYTKMIILVKLKDFNK